MMPQCGDNRMIQVGVAGVLSISRKQPKTFGPRVGRSSPRGAIDCYNALNWRRLRYLGALRRQRASDAF